MTKIAKILAEYPFSTYWDERLRQAFIKIEVTLKVRIILSRDMICKHNQFVQETLNYLDIWIQDKPLKQEIQSILDRTKHQLFIMEA